MKIEDFIGSIVRNEKKKILRRASEKSERVIDTGDPDLSDIFGIEMETKPISSAIPRKKTKENGAIKKMKKTSKPSKTGNSKTNTGRIKPKKRPAK